MAPFPRKPTLAIVLVLVLVAVLGFGLWWGDLLNPAQVAATQEVNCAAAEVDPFLQDLDALMAEWTDAVALADSTSRLALSPAVDKLQTLRRTAEALSVPDCGEYLRQMVVAWMDFRIDGYLTFMRQSGAPDAYATLRDITLPYTLAGDDLRDEIEQYRQAPLDTYRTGNQPEAWAACCPPDWWNIAMPFGGATRFSLPDAWQNVPARSADEVKFTDPDGVIVGTISQVDDLPAGRLSPRVWAFMAENFTLDAVQAETRYGRAGDTAVFAQIVPYRVTAHVQVAPQIAYLVTAANVKGGDLTQQDVETLLAIAASVRLD